MMTPTRKTNLLLLFATSSDDKRSGCAGAPSKRAVPWDRPNAVSEDSNGRIAGADGRSSLKNQTFGLRARVCVCVILPRFEPWARGTKKKRHTAHEKADHTQTKKKMNEQLARQVAGFKDNRSYRTARDLRDTVFRMSAGRPRDLRKIWLSACRNFDDQATVEDAALFEKEVTQYTIARRS